MAKKNTRYRCVECGSLSTTMVGRCTVCSAWGSIVEEERENKKNTATPSPLSVLEVLPQERIPSQIQELDRVLGGGWTPGGVILLGGEPGVGKSTLLLQVSSAMAQKGCNVLYISAEESAGQLAQRAQRIQALEKKLHLICEQDLAGILEVIPQYEFVVLDSVQAFRLADENGWPGSPTQVRLVASQAIAVAKEHAIPLVLVGHITKQGQLAGPKLLEHMVDVVLHFYGDRNSVTRLLRAEKNRFGSTEEVGLFEMSAQGLSPVIDPSHLYWEKTGDNVSGVALTAIMNGTRPLIAEIQSLTCATPFPYPKRTSRGIEVNRLQLLLAVLERHCALNVRSHDVYLNVVSGLFIEDPAADLAVCAALASSVKNIPLPESCCYIGEVGLAGEIRPVPRTSFRLKEAARLGFKCAIVSKREKNLEAPLKLIELETIKDLIERVL